MTSTTIKMTFPAGINARNTKRKSVWQTIQHWQELNVQRRHLAALTADQLRDVGIAPEQARIEASKPFWRD